MSRSHLQAQSIGQRLEAVESKTGRNLDAVNRMEQAHSEIEQAIRALRREDDVLAERARLAHEVAARLETEMHAQQEEYRVLPLLAERVELLRAERQRLEDRTSRAEESLEDVRTRMEREEEFSAHVDARLKAQDARIDHIHSSTLEYRRTLTDQLLKLNQMIERMKRREVEETERQVKELARAGEPAQERGRMTAETRRTEDDAPNRGVLRRFAEHLPITDATPMISLGEGDTPLVRSTQIVRDIGCEALYFKLESCNPTGSFKDRGMVVAVAKAMEDGAKAIMCASTGNTSASAAAYAGRYGLAVYVIVPDGNIARGKLAQSAVYGAQIIAIDGNFDAALRMAREITAKHPIALVNSVNPFRIEGQKTAAFEIVDALGDAPDVLALPVGNAGNITAYWKGFVEYHHRERTSRRPRMLGFQAAGAAPLVAGRAGRAAADDRVGDPDRQPGFVADGDLRPRRVRRQHRSRDRRRDPGGVRPPGARRRHLLRAGIGGERRRAAEAGGGRHELRGQDGRVHHHRQRPQGSGDGAQDRTADAPCRRRRGGH